MSRSEERAAVIAYLENMADRVEARSKERLAAGNPKWEADAGAVIALRRCSAEIGKGAHLR